MHTATHDLGLRLMDSDTLCQTLCFQSDLGLRSSARILMAIAVMICWSICDLLEHLSVHLMIVCVRLRVCVRPGSQLEEVRVTRKDPGSKRNNLGSHERSDVMMRVPRILTNPA